MITTRGIWIFRKTWKYIHFWPQMHSFLTLGITDVSHGIRCIQRCIMHVSVRTCIIHVSVWIRSDTSWYISGYSRIHESCDTCDTCRIPPDTNLILFTIQPKVSGMAPKYPGYQDVKKYHKYQNVILFVIPGWESRRSVHMSREYHSVTAGITSVSRVYLHVSH